MSYLKNHQTEIEERGYKDSNMNVCASHFEDSYIKNKIRYSHNHGRCSFCGRYKNVLPFNDLLGIVLPVVHRDYLPAIDNAIYDSEERRYLDPIIDPFDFVYEELNSYLRADETILKELMDTLSFEDRVSQYQLDFKKRQEEKDLADWDEYCKVVKHMNMSAEQIVSLLDKSTEQLTPDHSFIRNVLDTVWSYCRELNLIKTIYGISSQYYSHRYYRCVSYIDEFKPGSQKLDGLSFIPASMVGTAPAEKIKSGNRMSEAGDMMFYGADDKQTAIREIEAKPDRIITMGTFLSNKAFRILDLSDISNWKLPSIFDVENEKKRSTWFFLKEFMERISEIKSDDNFYKPTQVFTKYIQRRSKLQGIKYKSSKTGKPCYVLFVVNRDCLDPDDRQNPNRNQLVMAEVEQIKNSGLN